LPRSSTGRSPSCSCSGRRWTHRARTVSSTSCSPRAR
jgi:hypothetical protein